MAERRDIDLLFKALADPGRRKLLDLLHAHDGRTLTELRRSTSVGLPSLKSRASRRSRN